MNLPVRSFIPFYKSGRPYLLRKRTSDKQYQYSRDAAIESAKADLLGRREFMFEKPQNVKINSGGYRVYVEPLLPDDLVHRS